MLRLLVPLALAVLAALPARADTLRLDATGCVNLALENNRAIAAARARLDEAVAGKGAAFGSFLPQVNATATYTRLGTVSEFVMGSPVLGRYQFPVRDPQGNVIGYTDSLPVIAGYRFDTLQLGGADNFVLRGTVQQTFFTWGKLVNAYRIAGLSADLQRAAFDQARADVRVQAVDGFFRTLLARKTAALMAESRDQLQRHVGRVQALYDNGLATRLDLLRATVGLTNLKAQLAQVENGATLAEAALRTVIGVEDDRALALDDSLALGDTAVNVDAAIDAAFRNRPELAQLKSAARMAELGVRIARTANLPNAFAALNFDYKNPVGFTAGWGTDWNVTAGVSWPLFTGGANLAKLRQARARERQARVALAQVEDGVRLDVRAQAAAVQAEVRNCGYQYENVGVAATALELAETRYANGLLTNLEYLDTQLALMQAKLALLNSLANYQVARARLARATGER
jgi:outer membrane protein TolC